MQFIIPGKPVPLKRTRTTLQKNFIRHYNSQAKEIKELQKLIMSQLNSQHEPFPTDIPLHLILIFFMEIPKSSSKKKKKELEGSCHTKRPDLSNIQKYYEDAFNGIIWVDDCSIAKTSTEKIWSVEPRTVLKVIPIEKHWNSQ